MKQKDEFSERYRQAVREGGYKCLQSVFCCTLDLLKEYSKADTRIYNLLHDAIWSNREGTGYEEGVFLSIKTIAEKAKCSTRVVNRFLKKSGWLFRIKKIKSKKSKWLHNLYEMPDAIYDALELLDKKFCTRTEYSLKSLKSWKKKLNNASKVWMDSKYDWEEFVKKTEEYEDRKTRIKRRLDNKKRRVIDNGASHGSAQIRRTNTPTYYLNSYVPPKVPYLNEKLESFGLKSEDLESLSMYLHETSKRAMHMAFEDMQSMEQKGITIRSAKGLFKNRTKASLGFIFTSEKRRKEERKAGGNTT